MEDKEKEMYPTDRRFKTRNESYINTFRDYILLTYILIYRLKDTVSSNCVQLHFSPRKVESCCVIYVDGLTWFLLSSGCDGRYGSEGLLRG